MHEVVVAALVREGRVLLVHRSPSLRAYPGVWDLPGGHIEAGETELAALAREMHEELRVEIATGSAVRLWRWDAGRRGEPVRPSAWLVDEWQERRRTPLPTNTTESVGSGPRNCLRSPTNS